MCIIITVLCRKSHRRSVDKVERVICRNVEQGITGLLITDDTFARKMLKMDNRILKLAKIHLREERSDRPHATWCPTAIRAMFRRELYR